MKNFSEALALLKSGQRVARTDWKDMWIELQHHNIDSGATMSYIYLKVADGRRTPWKVSQTDVLSDDWMLVE
jgi:hypothetical protein